MTINEDWKQLKNTARLTGVYYLAMAISGVLGFLIFHPQLFIPDAPEKTLANLINLESTARMRLLFEFFIIISQALTAVWFYKLFKHVNQWAAWTLGIWGMINSMVIMISAISMASAIQIANSSVQVIENKILLIELLQNLITNAWSVGGLFFGLWLIPMGYLVIKSQKMPIWLGRILFLGGIGYLFNTIVNYLGIDFSYNNMLTVPATIGEFWMIGYLLFFWNKTGE